VVAPDAARQVALDGYGIAAGAEPLRVRHDARAGETDRRAGAQQGERRSPAADRPVDDLQEGADDDDEHDRGDEAVRGIGLDRHAPVVVGDRRETRVPVGSVEPARLHVEHQVEPQNRDQKAGAGGKREGKRHFRSRLPRVHGREQENSLPGRTPA
jgi:hypothetical protein